MPEASHTTTSRRFGPFELSVDSQELRKNGLRLKLSGQAIQVLLILTERPGSIVPREELQQRLWPGNSYGDFEHGLNAAVNRLREALGDDADSPRYIETLPRRGYRFVGPLEAPSPVQVTGTVTEKKKEGPGRSRSARSVVFAALTMLALLLALFTLVFVLHRGSGAKSTRQPPIKSIAVLPLKNLSGDAAQEYFADGMTEALIGRLSGIHDLRVISRTSVMRFKDTQLSVPEIAKTLQVDALVEGSVMRERNRIRVQAQLIRGATDEHFWSEAYDRELQDVLSLQSDVAQSIARRVEVTVTGEERARLTAVRSVSPYVYESYLRGQFTLAKNSNRAGVDESVLYFEEAIKRDPTFASAYVGLATAYAGLGSILVGAAPPEEERPKAISAARRALELDQDLADAYVVLAEMHRIQWHWAESEAEYRRALDLNPSHAKAHMGLALWLLCQGRIEEALDWSRRGRKLDPMAVSGSDVGWILFNAHRYDEAIQEFRSALATGPDDVGQLWYLGFALVHSNNAKEAIPFLEKGMAISNRTPAIVGVLVGAYAHAGRRTEALRLVDELRRRRQTSYVPAAPFVIAYWGLGDTEQTFTWLEEAYKEKSNLVQWLKVDPLFDPLRNDPRFRDLLRRVGLD